MKRMFRHPRTTAKIMFGTAVIIYILGYNFAPHNMRTEAIIIFASLFVALISSFGIMFFKNKNINMIANKGRDVPYSEDGKFRDVIADYRQALNYIAYLHTQLEDIDGFLDDAMVIESKISEMKDIRFNYTSRHVHDAVHTADYYFNIILKKPKLLLMNQKFTDEQIPLLLKKVKKVDKRFGSDGHDFRYTVKYVDMPELADEIMQIRKEIERDFIHEEPEGFIDGLKIKSLNKKKLKRKKKIESRKK